MDAGSHPIARRSYRLFLFFFALIHIVSALAAARLDLDFSPIQDALQYKVIALNVLAGNGFSVSAHAPYIAELIRPPSYPLFLALIFLVDTSGLLAALVQQLMIVALGAMILSLCVRYKLSSISYIAVALFFVEPLQWMLSLQTMSETFFGFFAFAALFALWSPGAESKKLYRGIVAGVCMGIAILARPTGILWLPACALVVFGWRESLKTKLLVGVSFILALAVCVTPWVIRNYRVVGKPLISSSYEYNIISNFGTPSESAALEMGDALIDKKGRRGSAMIGFNATEYARMKDLSSTIVSRIGFTRLATSQLMCTPKIWFNSRYNTILDMAHKGAGDGTLGTAAVIFDYIFWTLALVLVAVGVVSMAFLHKQPWHALALASILIANATISLCVSYTRMRVPLQPILFFLVALGLAYLKTRFTNYPQPNIADKSLQ